MAPGYPTVRDELELRLKRLERVLLEAADYLEQAFKYMEQLKKDQPE